MLLSLFIRKQVYNARINFRILFLKLVSFFIKARIDYVAFIPHGGMYGNGYDLRNYKSDNVLCLLVYMINRYGNRFKYRIACDTRQYDSIQNDIHNRYPNLDVSCVHFFGPDNFKWGTYKELLKCRNIFTCEGYPLPFKRPWHKVIFLSYFKPFKDDYDHIHSMKENYNGLFDICVSPSSIYSYIVAHTFNIPLSKFVTLGFSRDDMLLDDYQCPQLEDYIKSAVDYEVKKVFLYTPTHRDYERNSTLKRDILGFEVDKKRFEDFLYKNGILLICKMHTQQNSDVIDDALPKGVIIHSATEGYGLCELLQRADCLITDYTSTYFDYLLLDRPVLFDFYDYDKYEKERGFSYDPLESVLAGDVFSNETSFYEKARKIIDGFDDYKEKRKFVRDMQHKFIDKNSSRRICDYIFGQN